MENLEIREILKKDENLDWNTVRLLLSQDFKRELCITVLESDDDKKFFQKVLNRQVINYVQTNTGQSGQIPRGKHGVDRIMEMTGESEFRVIAICDRDYDEPAQNVRYFYCDGCNLEMMLLDNARLIREILQKYDLSEETIGEILRKLAPYSLLRKLNADDGLGISFRKIKILSAFDEKSGILDMKELFRKAGAEEDIDSCIQKADVLAEEELRDITNGHDALKVLGVICKDGTSTLGEKKLRGELIDNYKKEEFVQTNLYHSLEKYQSEHHLAIVENV